MEKLTKILSKSQVLDLFDETKNSIMSGEQNPLRVAVHLKALEELISKLRKDDQIQELILDQALKEGEKSFMIYGAEIQVKEMGVKYDYSICNDSLLEEFYKEMNELKKKIRDRENMLKNISDRNDIISDKGEVLYPPSKKSKTGIAIKLN